MHWLSFHPQWHTRRLASVVVAVMEDKVAVGVAAVRQSAATVLRSGMLYQFGRA